MQKLTVAALGCIWAFAAAASGQSANAHSGAVYREFDRFSEAYERVRENYVRPLDDSEIMTNAISGMLTGLDPHSSYMTAQKFAAMAARTSGGEAGIGLNVAVTGAGLVKVIAPVDGSPAANAGIKPGDFVSEIDGTSTEDTALDRVEEMMRGPVGSTVKLTIARRGLDAPIELSIVRAFVKIDSVKAERRGEIGYIRITAYDEGCTERLNRAIAALKKAGPLKGYILDLRNDPGGLLDEVASVTDAFLDKGSIFSTRGRHREDTQTFNAYKADATDGRPLVVLINEGSAAGSEITAGALQDNKRATIIGTRSFGSGTIQTIIPLGENQGALRLTTAQVYLPSGRTFQAVGIEPDIVVSQYPKGAMSGERPRREAALAGHIAGEAGADVEKTVVHPEAGSTEPDFQLAYALNFLNRKK